jgi:beta-N-acetylhexosaminidase
MKKIILILIVALFFFFLTKNYLYDIPKEDEELRDKIEQMLIIGFRGTTANEYITQTLKDMNLGGVILFDKDVPSNGEIERNIINPDQTKKLISDLKEIRNDIFVAVDAEGGNVNRLKEEYGFIPIPSAEEMGKSSVKQTEEYGLLLGQQLSELGFNLNFAPVVDVNVNPENPVIGQLERSFSDDPENVYSYAKSFIEGLHQSNIIPAIKHFPGHGSSTNDSHLGIVDVTNTYKEEEL